MNMMEYKQTTNNLPTLHCYFQIRSSRRTSNDWDDASIEIFRRLFSNGGESDLVYAKILSVLPRVRSDQILDSNRLIYYCKLLSNPPFTFLGHLLHFCQHTTTTPIYFRSYSCQRACNAITDVKL